MKQYWVEEKTIGEYEVGEKETASDRVDVAAGSESVGLLDKKSSKLRLHGPIADSEDEDASGDESDSASPDDTPKKNKKRKSKTPQGKKTNKKKKKESESDQGSPLKKSELEEEEAFEARLHVMP